MRGAGTSIAGNAVGPGRRHRHQPAPAPGARRRRRGADGDRRAGRRAGVAAGGRAAARPALRARPEHPQPLHDRRDDRQQRLRLAGAGLRPDVGQRASASTSSPAAASGCRLDGAPPAGVLDDLRALVGAASWRRSAPSSAASAGRCPATRWSTCCPSTASTWPGRWSAARARWRWCSARPSGWSPTPRTGAWSCSATPRWPTPPTRRPALLPHSPTAVEGLDARIVQRLRDVPAAVVPDLPRGDGWLIVELTGDTAAEVAAAARRVVADAGALDSLVVTDVGRGGGDLADPRGRRRAGRAHQRRPPGARRAGRTRPSRRNGSATTCASSRRCWTGTGCRACPYGHFGDGCVHVRIDFPFGTVRTAAPRTASFVEDAARLVAGYGGSLSGEHGDGRARSELLPLMYSPAVIDAVRPGQGGARPGRRPQPRRARPAGAARRGRPGGRGAAAPRGPGAGLPARRRRLLRRGAPLHRRRQVPGRPAARRVMCPSWPATREEKDTTRGRARVLQEMLAPGGPVSGWRAPEVHDALDLCLSCKGCSRDCPTGVDMATYKAEVLHQSYRRRLRPRPHYTLGRLPALGRPRRAGAPGGQRGAGSRLGGRLAKWAAGMDQRRERAAVRPPDLPAAVGRAVRPMHGRRPGAGGAVGGLVHRPLRPGGRVRGGPRAGGRRLPRPGARRRHLLRADLDHHRPARRRPAILGATVAHAGAGGRRRHPDRRAGAVLHGGAARRRAGAGRRPGRPSGSPAATRTLAELLRRDARAGSRRRWPGSRSSPSRTATTPRCSAGRPTPRCWSGRARRSPGSAAAAGWPATGAWSAGTTTCR